MNNILLLNQLYITVNSTIYIFPVSPWGLSTSFMFSIFALICIELMKSQYLYKKYYSYTGKKIWNSRILSVATVSNNLRRLGLSLSPKKTVLIKFRKKGSDPAKTKIMVNTTKMDEGRSCKLKCLGGLEEGPSYIRPLSWKDLERNCGGPNSDLNKVGG